MRFLSTLKPGTRFRLAEMPEVTGLLVRANDCRAVVRLDRPQREVEFIAQDGEMRQFRSRGARLTSWAPATLVEPAGFVSLNDEENEMSNAKTTKAPKNQSKARDAKPAKTRAKKGKMSAIDAAAKVLGEAKVPMNTRAMIEAMASKGYWKSPGGQTPHATLYSAILAEIRKKGKESRFKKTDKGTFALA